MLLLAIVRSVPWKANQEALGRAAGMMLRTVASPSTKMAAAVAARPRAGRWAWPPASRPSKRSTCWGDSKFGRWAGFMDEHIVYKMCWMPPGTFVMGSPEDEAEREDELKSFFEHPHQVTLSQGFWIAERPQPTRVT